MQQSEIVRILHITDTHLFADAQGALRGTLTAQTLEAVLRDIRERNWPADVVAVTGDLIQDDTAEAYERFRSLLSPLGMPVYCLPGNHDVRPLMQRALSAPPFYYCQPCRAGDWLLVSVDSCIDGDAGGRVDAAELQRVREVIAATDALHVLVCIHHPPLAMHSRWLDSVGLQDAAEFLAMLGATGRVRGLLFGHAHQAFESVSHGMRIMGTPSTCRQFLPGSDEFALDDRPPGYRRVTLLANGSIDTELLSVDVAQPA